MKARAGRILMVEGEAMHACDVCTNDVYACGGITNRRSWVGRMGRIYRLATLSFANLLLCAQSLGQTHHGVDAKFVKSLCPQYKGTNCPGRASLNTVSAGNEEFIGFC